MEQPNWLFIIFRHHDDGLNSLQCMDHISTFNLQEMCKICDGYRYCNDDDGLKDSSEVMTAWSRLKDLSIKRVKPGMTLQSSPKFSMREVTPVIDKIDKCEGKYERTRRLCD
jgi:hypothetical protein